MKIFCVLVALDLALMAFVACGEGETNTVYRKPPADNPTDQAWLDIKPLVDKNCASCHDGVKQKPALTSAASFKASNSKARLQSGTMPPAPKTIDPEDKAKLLAYLGG